MRDIKRGNIHVDAGELAAVGAAAMAGLESATKNVGAGIDKATKNVSKGVEKTTKDVGNFLGGLFDKH